MIGWRKQPKQTKVELPRIPQGIIRAFPKRTLWSIEKDGKIVFAADVDEIVAVNVPDSDKPGFILTLRSGNTVTFNEYDGDKRQDTIKYITNLMVGRQNELE